MSRISSAVLLVTALAATLSAATVSYNPAPTTLAGPSPCTNFAGFSCWTTAYFDANTLDANNLEGNIDQLFNNAWNSIDPLSSNGGYTLSITNDARNNLVPGNFNVTTAAAGQFGGVTLGGLTINVNASNVVASLPALGNGDVVVWVQGLDLNYSVPANGGIVGDYQAMDTTVLSGIAGCNGTNNPGWCPPAYPYQYNDDSFYDQPKDFYFAPGATQAYFNADAYLAIMNTINDTVTVYDGVDYGFQNYVSPEPGTFLLLALPLVAIGFAKLRGNTIRPA